MLRGAMWLPVERDADPNRVRRHCSAARSAVPTNPVAEALQQARNALLREMHNVYKYMQHEHDVKPDDVMATIMVGALTLSMREQEVQAASPSMLTAASLTCHPSTGVSVLADGVPSTRGAATGCYLPAPDAHGKVVGGEIGRLYFPYQQRGSPHLPACRHQHMRKREVDRMQELKTEMMEAGVKPCKDVSFLP